MAGLVITLALPALPAFHLLSPNAGLRLLESPAAETGDPQVRQLFKG